MFHAADVHGLPVNDLKLSELTLLDNGRPPRKILAFQPLQNFPIRAGILMDASESMFVTRSADRAIAIRYMQQLLRQQTDQAFVVNFQSLSTLSQPWTSSPNALTAAIRDRNIPAGSKPHIPGTAIFDTLYRTCLNQFGQIDNAASGNFILLFSDGSDNASHASLQQAVDICQHTNTAIYAFHPKFSTDSQTLTQLTTQTGGRAFYDDGSPESIDNDLRAIEADLRNQYRIIYRPQAMKHNGAFHHIELKTPDRVDTLTIRSGYYAPTR
ncbi:MAG: VWA domain-containing protein [Granulicella sp.]